MNKRKAEKILIIAGIPGFHINSPNSAVSNYLRTIRDQLISDGYEVSFLPGQNPDSVPRSAVRDSGLGSNLKKLLRKIAPYFYYSLLISKLLRFHQQLLSVKSHSDYRLIIEFYTIGSCLGLSEKKRTGAKLLLIYDNPVLLQFREMYHSATLLDAKVKSAEERSLKAADAILCYSASVKKFLEKEFRLEALFHLMPCIVWKNGHSPLKKRNDEIVIGFVGSFLNWHKVPLLLRAFEVIATEFSQAKLLLVGYGEEWEKVKEMQEKSSFRERIEMPGYVSDELLEELKSQFTIGVMPGSNWYGSPLKLFEYAGAGIPVIAPSTPVVKDLFTEGETALFIDSQNELNSLVENIRRLIMDKALSQRISGNAFDLMKGAWSKEKQMNNFSILVKNLISDGVKE